MNRAALAAGLILAGVLLMGASCAVELCNEAEKFAAEVENALADVKVELNKAQLAVDTHCEMFLGDGECLKSQAWLTKVQVAVTDLTEAVHLAQAALVACEAGTSEGVARSIGQDRARILMEKHAGTVEAIRGAP